MRTEEMKKTREDRTQTGSGRDVTRLGLLTAAYLLTLAAMFLVFCEPEEYSVHWLRDLLLTKVFGVAAAYGAWTAVKLSDRYREGG